MTAPPLRASLFPVGSTAPATAKALTAQQYDFAVQRLAAGTTGAGTATAAELQLARDSLQVGAISGRNKFKNGGMLIAQRTVLGTFPISTAAQIGQVDDMAVWASGGAVSGGTIGQVVNSPAGTTGYACRAAGVTLTGAGVLSFRKRVEFRDALQLKNKTGVFAAQVYHDAGVAVNYTVVVSKPTAADNYASKTTIFTSSVISVPSGIATQVAIPATALGDVSAGVEVEVRAACGAIAAKNFDVTEWQLEEAALPTIFEHRRFDDELRACQRLLPFFYFSGAAQTVGAGVYFSGTAFNLCLQLPVPTRVPVTAFAASVNNAFTVVTGGANNASTAYSFVAASLTAAEVGLTVAGVAGQGGLVRAAGVVWCVFGGAELAV